MLSKRILTAIVGIIITIFVIQYGQWLFTLAVAVITLLAWNEFSAILRNRNIGVQIKLGFGAIILILGCAWVGNSQETVMVITLASILALIKTVTSCTRVGINDAAFTILGIIYIGTLFSHLILLRFMECSIANFSSVIPISVGTAFLWMAFIGTWANDTFAYFVGSQWGKHKLCPAISPGKTVEGALGGLLGSIAVVTILGMWVHLPFLHSVILGILIGITAPFGDLAESALKRFAGVKDSGRLLPGHGGVLDRFDSILFTVPTVYYYVQVVLLH